MHLTDCHKASIYTLDETYLCDAVVSRTDENPVHLTFNEPAKDFLRSDVLVTFYDNLEGLVSYRCQLTEYKEYMSSPGVWRSNVSCLIGEHISAIQRRKDLKVQINILADLTFTDSEGVTQETKALLHNISAGGVFLTTQTQFATGQQFSFIFRTVSRGLKLTAEVLRIEAPAEENAPYGYGCRFIKLPAYAESTLRNYVYRQDLQTRKR